MAKPQPETMLRYVGEKREQLIVDALRAFADRMGGIDDRSDEAGELATALENDTWLYEGADGPAWSEA